MKKFRRKTVIGKGGFQNPKKSDQVLLEAVRNVGYKLQRVIKIPES